MICVYRKSGQQCGSSLKCTPQNAPCIAARKSKGFLQMIFLSGTDTIILQCAFFSPRLCVNQIQLTCIILQSCATSWQVPADHCLAPQVCHLWLHPERESVARGGNKQMPRGVLRQFHHPRGFHARRPGHERLQSGGENPLRLHPGSQIGPCERCI
jgi:hypothetical protein